MQKFLAGVRLPRYGGQSFKLVKAVHYLPSVSPEEAEEAVLQLLCHPETERPARPDAVAGPISRPTLKTCKGVPFPKVRLSANRIHKSGQQEDWGLKASISENKWEVVRSIESTSCIGSPFLSCSVLVWRMLQMLKWQIASGSTRLGLKP